MAQPSLHPTQIRELKVIGSTDCLDFPDFGLENIDCKIDTGAGISALHCHSVRLVEKDGQQYVSFKLLDPKHPAYQKREFRSSDFKERKVKSSFGASEFRFSIRTRITVMGKTYKAEFTLTDRKRMKYPVLLGKRFLKNRFLVDVALKNQSFFLKNEAE
ncbi:hypothetical protein GC167_08415 [bacterium]|nr:hypothetical protein [bacterium]